MYCPQCAVSYVPQQPWLRQGTVRSNILGLDQHMDTGRYNTTVAACALSTDLTTLPAGDRTEIGEKGSTLSGGQRQRINLARAVYESRDLYLMDDPISAVDQRVGLQIFHDLIGQKGLLRDATRIVATSTLHWLPEADVILVISEGELVEKGDYHELLSKGGYFSKLMNSDKTRSLKRLNKAAGKKIPSKTERVTSTGVVAKTGNAKENIERSRGLRTKQKKVGSAVSLYRAKDAESRIDRDGKSEAKVVTAHMEHEACWFDVARSVKRASVTQQPQPIPAVPDPGREERRRHTVAGNPFSTVLDKKGTETNGFCTTVVESPSQPSQAENSLPKENQEGTKLGLKDSLLAENQGSVKCPLKSVSRLCRHHFIGEDERLNEKQTHLTLSSHIVQAAQSQLFANLSRLLDLTGPGEAHSSRLDPYVCASAPMSRSNSPLPSDAFDLRSTQPSPTAESRERRSSRRSSVPAQQIQTQGNSSLQKTSRATETVRSTESLNSSLPSDTITADPSTSETTEDNSAAESNAHSQVTVILNDIDDEKSLMLSEDSSQASRPETHKTSQLSERDTDQSSTSEDREDIHSIESSVIRLPNDFESEESLVQTDCNSPLMRPRSPVTYLLSDMHSNHLDASGESTGDTEVDISGSLSDQTKKDIRFGDSHDNGILMCRGNSPEITSEESSVGQSLGPISLGSMDQRETSVLSNSSDSENSCLVMRYDMTAAESKDETHTCQLTDTTHDKNSSMPTTDSLKLSEDTCASSSRCDMSLDCIVEGDRRMQSADSSQTFGGQGPREEDDKTAAVDHSGKSCEEKGCFMSTAVFNENEKNPANTDVSPQIPTKPQSENYDRSDDNDDDNESTHEESDNDTSTSTLTDKSDDEDDDEENRDSFMQTLIEHSEGVLAGCDVSESREHALEASLTSCSRSGAAWRLREMLTSTSCEPLTRGRQHHTLVDEEHVQNGKVKWQVYSAIAQALGGLCCIIMTACYVLYHVTSVAANYWLSYWTDEMTYNVTSLQFDSVDVINSSAFYLAVYGAFGAGQCIFVVTYALLLAFRRVGASRDIHRALLDSVLDSPLAFFHRNPAARVLNRMSRDLEVLDTEMWWAIEVVLDSLCHVISTCVVVCLGSPYYLLVILPVSAAYYFIQRYYIGTSRQLRRLEGKTRSPVFTHLSQMIDGSVVLRATGTQATEHAYQTAASLVDSNLRFTSACNTAGRWLGVRVAAIGVVIVGVAASLGVALRNRWSGGLLGLAITYALDVTENLNWLVRMAGDLETNAVSVERMLEYTCLTPEMSFPTVTPQVSWPKEGRIQFINLSASYSSDSQRVLRGIDCMIQPGEKVGVVGRTGAGKTTLWGVLLGLMTSTEGAILIDDVDTRSVPLQDLRSRVAVMPQEPLILNASVRMNLDPTEEASDSAMWAVLRQTQLANHVCALPGGLDYICQSGGLGFSAGQRQLLCLARILLRHCRVIVLDEATSSVDVETDDVICQTIQLACKECTVLIVSHRLSTVMHCDRVMVLEQGRLAEIDTPSRLLHDPFSHFSRLAASCNMKQ
ncbi:uncharacterized protein [Littorina saxatilis]|uniref:uncharacterized protein n=1 Tax=Littorina saxatilis TaxID=31220 RepID=UPI0038B5CD0C